MLAIVSFDPTSETIDVRCEKHGWETRAWPLAERTVKLRCGDSATVGELLAEYASGTLDVETLPGGWVRNRRSSI